MTTVGVGRPQRLWKPVGIFQQPFRFAGHVAFFQVIDHASELLSARFGHIGKDARFGHAAEIAIDCGLPACRHDIKTNGMRQHVAVSDAACNAMRRHPAIVVFGDDLGLRVPPSASCARRWPAREHCRADLQVDWQRTPG